MTAAARGDREPYSKAYVVVMKQPYGCHGGPACPAFREKEKARNWARAAEKSLKASGRPAAKIAIAAVKIYEGRPTFLVLGGSPCFYGGVAGDAVRSFPAAAAALAYGLRKKVKNPRALFVEIAGPAGPAFEETSQRRPEKLDYGAPALALRRDGPGGPGPFPRQAARHPVTGPGRSQGGLSRGSGLFRARLPGRTKGKPRRSAAGPGRRAFPRSPRSPLVSSSPPMPPAPSLLRAAYFIGSTLLLLD